MNSNTSVRKNPKTIYSYYVHIHTTGVDKEIYHSETDLDALREYMHKNVAWIMKRYDTRRQIGYFPIRYLSVLSYEEGSRTVRQVAFFEPAWTDYELFDRPEYIVKTWQTK